nr:MAG TPA: hypothetical protein [Bacteriophage sp.]DAU91327.1 MAG TPA: hypothetical protein [Bacteriophage sp.]
MSWVRIPPPTLQELSGSPIKKGFSLFLCANSTI